VRDGNGVGSGQGDARCEVVNIPEIIKSAEPRRPIIKQSPPHDNTLPQLNIHVTAPEVLVSELANLHSSNPQSEIHIGARRNCTYSSESSNDLSKALASSTKLAQRT
jgi:hypothetical protein